MGFHYIPAANAAKSIAVGSYTGDDSDGRQIATGFKCSMVFIVLSHASYPYTCLLIPNSTVREIETGDHTLATAEVYLHASNGFVVGQTTSGMNNSSYTYYWWAISE